MNSSRVVKTTTSLVALATGLFLWQPASAQIQAEFGVLGGLSSAPFDYSGGYFYAGFIDLPLIATAGVGILQGEVLVGLAASDNNPETLTTALLGTQSVLTDQRELEVLFGLKYRFDAAPRIKPYAVVGPGIFVDLNNPSPLVAGQVPVPPELQARGIPTGQGFFRAGAHGGVGVEIIVVPELSIGAEGRYMLQEGTNANFATVAGRVAFHF